MAYRTYLRSALFLGSIQSRCSGKEPTQGGGGRLYSDQNLSLDNFLGPKPNPKIKIWRMTARVLQSSSKVLEGWYSTSFLHHSSSSKPYVKQIVSLVCASESVWIVLLHLYWIGKTGVFSKSRLRFFEHKNEPQLNCTTFRTTDLSGIVVLKKSILFVNRYAYQYIFYKEIWNHHWSLDLHCEQNS